MDTLQKNGYDLAKAMSTLVPQGGPVLCRDEMEEWSASEAMLFEEALEKYGKDFNDIRQDFVSSEHSSQWHPYGPSFMTPRSCSLGHTMENAIKHLAKKSKNDSICPYLFFWGRGDILTPSLLSCYAPMVYVLLVTDGIGDSDLCGVYTCPFFFSYHGSH